MSNNVFLLDNKNTFKGVHASSGPGSMTKASSVRWAKNPFKAALAKGKLKK